MFSKVRASLVNPADTNPVFQTPVSHEHRSRDDSDPAVLCLITRQLTKRDPEYFCDEAEQARATERDRLIQNASWSLTPIAMSQARVKLPNAKFCRVFTITGIKDSEDSSPQIPLGTNAAPPKVNEVKKRKFKARSVAQGSNVYDKDGQPAIYGSDVSSHASSFTAVRSIAAFGAATNTPVSTIDATQAFVQPRLDLSNTDEQFFVELPPDLQTDEQKKLCVNIARPVFQLPLYGLPIASAKWQNHLHDVLISQSWTPVESWPSTFVKASSNPKAPNLCLSFVCR